MTNIATIQTSGDLDKSIASQSIIENVYTSGNQTIDGIKTFTSDIYAKSGLVSIGKDRAANGSSLLDFVSQNGATFNTRMVRQSGANGNLDIQQAGTGNINIVNGSGSDIITIQQNGFMKKPFTPAFHATAGQPTAQGNDVTYTNSIFNTGSYLNLGNGRFTAPVAGVYYFRYHQLAPNAPAGECRTALYVNGNGYGGLRFITIKPANSWWSLIAQGHIKLNINDYVTVRIEQTPANMYTDANYGSFTGHFIG